MQTEAEKPHNYKNNENRPKHGNLLCSFGEHQTANLILRSRHRMASREPIKGVNDRDVPLPDLQGPLDDKKRSVQFLGTISDRSLWLQPSLQLFLRPRLEPLLHALPPGTSGLRREPVLGPTVTPEL